MKLVAAFPSLPTLDVVAARQSLCRGSSRARRHYAEYQCRRIPRPPGQTRPGSLPEQAPALLRLLPLGNFDRARFLHYVAGAVASPDLSAPVALCRVLVLVPGSMRGAPRVKMPRTMVTIAAGTGIASWNVPRAATHRT